MTSDDVAKTSDFVAAPAVLPAGVRTKIFIYLGVLVVLLGLPGGLIGLPISFLLKNKLHLKAHEMAIFGLITGAPGYVSFLFGFARDTWNSVRATAASWCCSAACAQLFTFYSRCCR
jgi:hypothetical protein